jgi:transcriptional regulator with XRE-family HTH domain
MSDLNVEVVMRLRGLRQARQRQGVSISQLAELSDLRRERITRYEHGNEDVEPAIVRRLALVLGVSQQELVQSGTIATDLPASAPGDSPQKPVSVRRLYGEKPVPLNPAS